MKTLALVAVLLTGGAAVLRAADVDVYAVTKARSYSQTSAGAPAPLATGGFTFVSVVQAHTGASVTSATLQLPSATVKPFGPVPGVGSLAVEQSFDTQAALDAAYASGSYLFTIHAVTDGTQTPALSLSGSSYPNSPTVTNFAAAQNIDWTHDFALTWGTFVGGTATDNIQVTINRADGTQVFATPGFGSTGVLPGTATAAVVPANTLTPGVSYIATLYFGRIVAVNFTSYPGVPGATVFVATTQFPVVVPGTTPTLHIARDAAPGTYDLTWNADIGRTYDLRWSADLMNWTSLGLFQATSTTETQTDTPGAGVDKRFYRLQPPP